MPNINPFEVYSRGVTVAPMWTYPMHYYHPDFLEFLQHQHSDPTFDEFQDQSEEQKQFVRDVFGTSFHAIWGRFDQTYFGSGDDVLFYLEQNEDEPDHLVIGRFSKEARHIVLDGRIAVTSNSISFVGPITTVTLRRTEHFVNDQNVYLLQILEGDRVRMNANFVPVTF